MCHAHKTRIYIVSHQHTASDSNHVRCLITLSESLVIVFVQVR